MGILIWSSEQSLRKFPDQGPEGYPTYTINLTLSQATGLTGHLLITGMWLSGLEQPFKCTLLISVVGRPIYEEGSGLG